jgi:hypothetical protein
MLVVDLWLQQDDSNRAYPFARIAHVFLGHSERRSRLAFHLAEFQNGTLPGNGLPVATRLC